MCHLICVSRYKLCVTRSHDGNATGKFTFDNPALQTVTVTAGSLPSSAVNAEKATVVVKAPVTAAVISDSTRSLEFTIFRLNMFQGQDTK